MTLYQIVSYVRQECTVTGMEITNLMVIVVQGGTAPGVRMIACQKYPAGHPLQFDWPSSSWYDPEAHRSGAELPTGQ
jgi:hypothetical protein